MGNSGRQNQLSHDVSSLSVTRIDGLVDLLNTAVNLGQQIEKSESSGFPLGKLA
jgi:hypothetical protein